MVSPHSLHYFYIGHKNKSNSQKKDAIQRKREDYINSFKKSRKDEIL
jgi:hypothetical protein